MRKSYSTPEIAFIDISSADFIHASYDPDEDFGGNTKPEIIEPGGGIF